jgi:hypothetical protein
MEMVGRQFCQQLARLALAADDAQPLRQLHRRLQQQGSHGPGYGIGNANPQLQRAVVLVFIGAKMLAAQWYHLPVHVSLGIVGLILLVAIAASLLRPARHSA